VITWSTYATEALSTLCAGRPGYWNAPFDHQASEEIACAAEHARAWPTDCCGAPETSRMWKGRRRQSGYCQNGLERLEWTRPADATEGACSPRCWRVRRRPGCIDTIAASISEDRGDMRILRAYSSEGFLARTSGTRGYPNWLGSTWDRTGKQPFCL